MSTAAARVIGRGVVQQGGLTYLFRDLFTTAAAAPLPSLRTCEPGPGQLTMTDVATGADASIGGGKYLRPRPTAGQGWGNYGAIATTGIERRPGLTAYTVVQSATIDRAEAVGFKDVATLNQSLQGVVFLSPTAILIREWAQQMQVIGSLSTNVDYQVAIVLRGTGALYLIRGGSQFPNWTLLYVGAMDATPLPIVQVPNYNADTKHDEVAVAQKGGLLALAYGRTAFFNPFPNSGDTSNGTADGLDYITWTPVAGETLSIYFRRVDDDNCYRIDCAQAAGTIKLFRRVAGVDTELAAGQTQTWTAGTTSYRIGVVYVGGEIRTFVEQGTSSANSASAKHVVTGESYNLTITGGKVSGFAGASNWERWPRVLSGTDLRSLA